MYVLHSWNIYLKYRSNWRSGTCFCKNVKRAESWLIGSRAQVQAEVEQLASPDDQPVHTVQFSAMVEVVELTLQVPAFDVQSWQEEQEEKNVLKKRNITI